MTRKRLYLAVLFTGGAVCALLAPLTAAGFIGLTAAVLAAPALNL